MSDDGLVERDEHKLIHFTERGREVAERIVARHRLVEAYLVKVMGIPWDDVHEEAHAMEHSISPRLEAKMLEMIGEVRTCPHGHPIGDYPREPGEPIPAVPVGQRDRRAAARERGRGDAALHEAARRRAGRRYTVAGPRRRRRRGDHALRRRRRRDSIEVDDRLARTVSVRVVGARRRPRLGPRRSRRRAAAAWGGSLGHVERCQAPLFDPDDANDDGDASVNPSTPRRGDIAWIR